jgi:hypothetical protein
MALRLLYYNLIFPIEKIPDFDGYLAERNYLIGRHVRYDEYLCVDGSDMGYPEERLQYWNDRAGLVGMVEDHGRNRWVDLCCVGQGEGLCPDAVCEWIKYDPFRECVFHVSDKQKKIVSLLPSNVDFLDSKVDGYIVKGRFLSPTKKSRGVVGLDDDYCVNFDSKGFFRFVLPFSWKREQRITQRMFIHDFVSDKQYTYEFELLANNKTILEINGDDGAAQIDYEPFEPNDKENGARQNTLIHKTSLDEAEIATPLTQEEIDELLKAIADGTLKMDAPSPSVQGRQVAIITKSSFDEFDRFECEYFGWNTNPLLKQPGEASLKSIPFETVLARKMEKYGYRFTEVSDPYQVDWNHTLFFCADEAETTTTEGAEIAIVVRILKITLTTHKASGQPCLAEERVWEGKFTLDSAFYQDNGEYVAERIGGLINESDKGQIEEW